MLSGYPLPLAIAQQEVYRQICGACGIRVTVRLHVFVPVRVPVRVYMCVRACVRACLLA
jgi:hypothetical protein